MTHGMRNTARTRIVILGGGFGGRYAALRFEKALARGDRSDVAASITTPRSGGSALAAVRQHWPEYLMEAIGLGLFMLSACLFVTL
jgi:NADPH-dependent 2,4-dienoyl-CoA reductase/sulfur reductase-like enzyme